MSKILALGTGPLLESGVRNFSAHCLRTWHLTRPLLDAGHEVALFTVPIYADRPDAQLEAGLEERRFEGFAYRAFLNCDDVYNLKRLAEAAEALKPDALLGINSHPCHLLSRLECARPMWADLNGSVAIEAQVKAAVYGNNSQLAFYWEMEEAALARADRFSTVSMRQLYALHGELASVGRLNRHTVDFSFASHIPNAFNPIFAGVERGTPTRPVLRGPKAPRDAFIVLWSGGYNSWTDVDFLARALEQAMEACPQLHYVSTGGAIYGHDDLTYPKFQALVRASRFRDRFHLLGWVDSTELPAIYAEADLGLCVDAKNTETMFGARNRTINLMAAGVPVLTGRGSEIGEELAQGGYALSYEGEDPARFAEALIEACRGRETLGEMAERARRYVLGRFTYEQTTRDLVAWASAPSFAPDNQVKIDRAGSGVNPFELSTNPLEERRARLAARNGARRNGGGRSIKRWAERTIGAERYGKLRFLRREWAREYLPRYLERRRQIGQGQLGRLEDLYIFLTNACNARCKHCFFIDELGHVPGELGLAEYERIAPSLPRLRRLTLTGGEAILHPECGEIIELLGRATSAERLTIITNGFLPAKLESLCARLLEEHAIPGVLDVLVSIDGLEETHNEVRANRKAWHYVNQTLATLGRLKSIYPGRFDLGVITIINESNYTEIEALNDHLRRHYDCNHGFEIIRGSEFSVWGLPEEVRTHYDPPSSGLPPREKWDEILATLQRINRRAGIPNHAFHLTAQFTFKMLRTGKRIMDCVSAGQNVGVLYSKGEVAMCEFSKPFGSLADYEMDFGRAWTSPEAEAMRAQLRRCHCTHGCYLSKNIEYSLKGQLAMVKDL